MKNVFGKTIRPAFLIVLIGIGFAIIYTVPARYRNWGMLTLSMPRLVTVTGQGKAEQVSQIASFTAGVYAVNDDKDQAIGEVNSTISEIIDAVKEFGIDEKDIKTQNLSVYQSDEQYYEEGRQKYRPGQWRASNDIEVTLRDPAKAGELARLLTGSGATNVYGPNFRIDDTRLVEDVLLQNALDDARRKAATLAQASGKSVGSIIQIQESQSGPVYPLRLEGAGGGGDFPVEPGSSTVTKTITVTFELE